MRFKVFALLLCLCVWGCGDEVFSQVLEIISPDEIVVSAPPESVWDGILNQRFLPREPAYVARQRAIYTKYIDAWGITIAYIPHINDDLDEHDRVMRYIKNGTLY